MEPFGIVIDIVGSEKEGGAASLNSLLSAPKVILIIST